IDDYTITSAPDGTPVHTAQPALYLLLRWGLPAGTWPEGISVSVRPRFDGAMIALADGTISQQDASAPMRGLSAHAATPEAVTDAYRLPLNEPLPHGADEIIVILYDSDSGAVLDEIIRPVGTP